MLNIEKFWYQNHPLRYALWPLSWIYRSIIVVRQKAYQWQWLKTQQFSVPIIVIGNLTVGGTGKTPVVIALARWLKTQGFQPGIVSRGYKGQAKTWPQWVTPTSDPSLVGDEPVLIAMKTQVPVMVGPKRAEAVKQLLQNTSCNVILSDDGLQHYALGRQFEVAAIDAKRGLGNSLCLPAGPLREPKSRLASINYLLVNGGQGDNGMQLQKGLIYNIRDPNHLFDHALHQNKKVHAVVGIGNPDRFFRNLQHLGLKVIEHRFPDHANYSEQDLDFKDNNPIIMTEKDMVKCYQWCSTRCYAAPVEAKLPEAFYQNVLNIIKPRNSN